MTKTEQAKLNELGKQIDAIAIDVSVVKTVLLGVSGSDNGGLCKVVSNHTQAITEINKRLSSFQKCFWVLVGILIGSGILTGIQIYGA